MSTHDPVAESERLALAAKDKAENLRAQVLAGDTKISATDLATAEAEVIFTDLQVTAAKRATAEAAQHARLVALQPLHDEMAKAANADGKELVTLLHKVDKALEDYANAFEARRELHLRWRRTMAEQGITDLPGLVPTPPEDAHIGHRDGTLIVDNHKIDHVFASTYLGAVIGKTIQRHRAVLSELTVDEQLQGNPFEMLNRAASNPEPWIPGGLSDERCF